MLLLSEAYFQFLWKREKKVYIITAHSKISRHLSPWHESESKDLYNEWHGCCKLVSPYFLSSHGEYKHPLPAETQREADVPACSSRHRWSGTVLNSLTHLFAWLFHKVLYTIVGEMWAFMSIKPKSYRFETQIGKTATACLITNYAYVGLVPPR